MIITIKLCVNAETLVLELVNEKNGLAFFALIYIVTNKNI